MKDINAILGTRIRLGRKNRQLTRERLAEMIDVSPRFLADVESGKVGVALQTLKNLSTSLCVTTDYLLGLENEEALNRYEILCLQLKAIDEKFYPLILAIVREIKNIV